MNETAGQSLVETLNKEHGPDRALFLLCNVESEEEIKGNMHTQQNVNGGGKGVCVCVCSAFLQILVDLVCSSQ